MTLQCSQGRLQLEGLITVPVAVAVVRALTSHSFGCGAGHTGERAAVLTAASMAGGAGPAAAPFITSRTSLQPLSEGDLDIQFVPSPSLIPPQAGGV